jgi:hypothetical protein
LKTPGPGNYRTKDNINEMSVTKSSFGNTKFGKFPRNEIDKHLYLNPEFPGPGTYARVSDFGGNLTFSNIQKNKL